jgi:steroid delta-isomerase-like uncharacterized protein
MSTENKGIVRRLVEELWTKGNLSVADELFFESYTHHDPSTPDFEKGPEGEKKRLLFYRTAFPDLQFTIEDMIGEGETVTCRWSSTGTHQGPLSVIAPSGKRVSVSGMTFVKFAGGKIVEGWVNWDTFSLLQQLGVVPIIIKKLEDQNAHAKWHTATSRPRRVFAKPASRLGREFRLRIREFAISRVPSSWRAPLNS